MLPPDRSRTRRGRLLAAALVLASTMPAGAADAPAPDTAPTLCMARERLVRLLTGQYGETVLGRGVLSPRELVEIWTSPSGTWTAVVVLPDGSSCISSDGEGWQSVTPPVAGRAS